MMVIYVIILINRSWRDSFRKFCGRAKKIAIEKDIEREKKKAEGEKERQGEEKRETQREKEKGGKR